MADLGIMDEHTMTSGVIPVRHPSLPGVIKLPRRYEKAALGDARTARHRKVSICLEPARMRETISGRLDDLMTAIMWVKQELILLRQHDILLKRQFFDINDSIQTLQTRKDQNLTLSSTSSVSSSISPTSPHPKSLPPLPESETNHQHNIQPPTKVNGDPNNNPLSSAPASPTADPNSTPTSPARIRALLAMGRLRASSSDLQLQTFRIRQSFSASVLTSDRVGAGRDHDEVDSGGCCRLNGDNDDDSTEDTDGDDTFDEHYFRPRTSSMKTSRDLAALARRRGSKELNQLL